MPFAPHLYIPGAIVDVSCYTKAFDAIELPRRSLLERRCQHLHRITNMATGRGKSGIPLVMFG